MTLLTYAWPVRIRHLSKAAYKLFVPGTYGYVTRTLERTMRRCRYAYIFAVCYFASVARGDPSANCIKKSAPAIKHAFARAAGTGLTELSSTWPL
ncbi:hypothetical protein EVAR_34449_1 [Eumeta japonica]|uniref:Uncharacterized protein n=1 Tax=Eumeta variegata TaxID=151549 RepID=A0A4C1WKL5_EUMVA|nr:hypothetical protein EVAR_34449_1 [Eumeta japonica]